MKIALLGYGRMGKMIEGIALDRGHSIVAKIDNNDPFELNGAEVAIDFSTPDAAFGNLTKCFAQGVPVICGTTGWLDRFDEAVANCSKHDGGFIYASNFSLGVNLFFELNKKLAQMMQPQKDYKTSLTEIHHIHKLDAPSGTGITLAEGVLAHSDKENWSLDGKVAEDLPIYSIREGEVPGTHTVTYESKVDTIEITHEAHNREGFALGAVVAAEWIIGKTGIFTMKDVLGL
ncbi:4-hydroxy-tetrahydrodipicolinate reductase [Sediminicola luteus]|uniref:4-hydroxy-tetrahydrodipicolinate reductase n=1 Tax=Sediminicola luteus TaxID=319238 RepID=A0A2A4GA28_9FLAO|nr:4-hydroxy-tetrahydrodipicolinate reductase [Sediminicola luteus]PCE64830.1 4-hydroxy-tetrahydrodipicolinate reductase [Sediminicola luteus]